MCKSLYITKGYSIMEKQKIEIGNVKDSNAVSLDLDYIADFDVEIIEFNRRIEIHLTTYELLTKSDFEKLKKYFEKYDYEFQSIYASEGNLILTYMPIKESD